MPAKKESARNLPPQRIRRIGFFAPAEAEFVQHLVEGVLRFQADRGGCIIRDFRYDPAAPEDQQSWATRPHPWKNWSPDGLVTSIAPDPGLAEWVQAAGCPVVNTNSYIAGFPAVFTNREQGVRLALSHFQTLGLGHIAYVTCVEHDKRIPVLRRLLQRSPIPLQIAVLCQNPSHWNTEIDSEVAADPALIEILRNSAKPLAVLAMNDDVGRVVCLAADRLGLNVPSDVAVLGINNSVASRTSFPPLSSIQTPFEEIGFAAMEMLLRILDGRPGPDRVEIPSGKLFVRESTSIGDDRETDVVRARQVIRDRAFEGISIEQIANELKVSRSTLHRDFTAIYGHGPGEELSRIRIAHARDLLKTTRLPVTRIAAMIGYSSLSSFAAFFRNQTGMTPRAFRTAGRGE